jgi:hypothetical protein
MATTPSTSISSSYQRLGGSTPVITQTGGPGGGGPRLAPKKSLKDKALEEFEAQKAVDEARFKQKEESLKQFFPVQYQQLQMKRQYDRDVAGIQRGEAPSKSSQAYFRNEMKGMQKLPWQK